MAKRKSFGTIFYLEIAGILTPIAQIMSITGPDAEVEEVATPTLDDGESTIPHDVTGRVEGNSCDFEYYYDPALASHLAINALLTTPAAKACKVQYTVGDPTTFNGIVKKATPTSEVGQLLKASASVQVSSSLVLPT